MEVAKITKNPIPHMRSHDYFGTVFFWLTADGKERQFPVPGRAADQGHFPHEQVSRQLAGNFLAGGSKFSKYPLSKSGSIEI